MKSSSEERRCTDCDVGRDCLSEMPDDVIIRILSFLPTRDAVRTVLLRRFGNLWTLVPSLNFDILEFFHKFDEFNYLEARLDSDDVGRFYLFGRNVLILHKRLSIDELRLHVDSGHDDGSILMWLRFALDRQAKKIRYFDSYEDFLYYGSFLPNLTSQYLVTLELTNCRINPQHQVNLGSLKKLKLKRVAICEDTFQRLLSGCPSLQELGIVDPFDIDELTFRAPNIHKLSLDLDFEFHSWSLDLSNLKSLDLNISGIRDIINVSSVRNVSLHCYEMDEDEGTSFRKFLVKFKGATTFRIPHIGSELFLHSLEDLNLSQTRWKRVMLDLSKICESCFVGIRELLRRLEHLEELILRAPLRGTNEAEFVKRVSSFEKASTNARIIFVSSLAREYYE